MSDKKYLNEEKYKKTEKSLTIIAILILIIGLCIGGFLIYRGTVGPETSGIEELRAELESKRTELESKGLEYHSSAKYTDGEEYDLKIVTDALDPSFHYCEFDEWKNNALTKDYCAAKNKAEGFDSDYNSSTLKGVGGFICFAAFIISLPIFIIAKMRHIAAFTAQQTMPVAKEATEKMAPTVGVVAKEITKGVKEGLKEDENKKSDKEE